MTCTVAYVGVVDVLLPAVGTAVVTTVVMYQYHQVTWCMHASVLKKAQKDRLSSLFSVSHVYTSHELS